MRIGVLAAALALAFVIGLFAVPSPGLAGEDGEKTLKVGGDFRGRYEAFWFNEDPTGDDRKNRGRFRYRFRLNLDAWINEHFRAGARLTTGGDNNSGNQTLGSPEDFTPSEFLLRRAYVTWYPFAKGDLPGERDGGWQFDFGRVPNPYIWKNGPDKMVWDSDIALSGVSTVFDIKPSGGTRLFAATGYYPIDENSSAKDPILVPFQAGLEVDANDDVRFGARGTFYYYDELNDAFFSRAGDRGNIVDGLAGDDMSSLSIVEGQGFVKFAGSDAWPITAFGGVAVNTSAVEPASEPGAGKANTAFNFGAEIGDKKKSVRVGAGWLEMEANALVALYVDSDYLDGITNRKGVIGYVQRQVMKSTEVGGTIFYSEPKDKTLGDPTTLEDSERWRLQLDLVTKF